MKKVLSVFLIVLLFTSGCVKEKTHQEIYTEATEKMSQLKSSDISATMTFVMEAMGEKMTMAVDMDMKTIMGGTNPQMESSMNMEMPEIGALDVVMYYTDGYMYAETMGVKYKMAVPVEEAMASTVSLPDTGAELLKELTAEKTEAGKVLKFRADSAAMSEYMNKMMSVSSVEGMTTGLEYELGDVTGSYTVNEEGYITEMNLTCQMNVDMMGEVVTADMQVQLIYNNPGQDVVIQFPDFTGYEDYTDLLG